MSEEQNYTFKSWVVENIESIKICCYVALLIFTVIVVFTDDDMQEMIKQNNDYHSEMQGKALYSSNCETIKDGLDSLLSSSANADSWLPNRDDMALKNGQERYDILC